MKPVILVIEDDAAVRDAVLRDLRPFAPIATIEAAESAEEAWEVVAGLDEHTPLALVLADHRLPGRSGVDLLVELAADPRGRTARKVLVTGQAGHDDTITYVPFPEADPTLLVDESVEVPVQVNGKVRARIMVPADADAGSMEALALADPKVQAALDGKQVRKVIAVPGRTVNVVVG